MSNGDLADLILAPYIDMSTSIVRIYTSEGFVIAADGRNYSLETESTVSDSVQKIFPVEEQRRCLVYSVTGTAELTPKGSNEVIFDILASIHAAVSDSAGIKFKSLWHYANALSERLADLPDHAKRAVIGDEPATIIFFDGYYDGRPKRAHISLFYDGQAPEVSTMGLSPGQPIGVGSNEILRTLGDANSILTKYRTPSLEVKYDDRTLVDAIEVARSWMSSHCGPEAEGIDPRCVSMGGRVLMCTLTPRDGFRWIQYEPI